ncbi:SpaH/EbpB family LPXTG-anchored major pilin [uncultured Ruminococcus sp.]|uniref:SpaH/EbpB family LPXTG-anchored major pilin n=1 Tax=uncultured Ruminococcus sp. TaxID=165186 RepID=UPI00260B05CF|nr:SpaH/EbpB family LPXTG-anchored major pilin [uncultured Ruminococcus sp.]
MKTKKFAVLLFTLILALGLFPMGVCAEPRDVAADSTASITIENAVENDVLAAYKVIDITYNATSNHVSYAWNNDFADYFAQTNSVTNSANQAYTVEQFAALTDESADLKNLLAGLPKYIADNNIAAAKTATVTSGTATFADLAMGEYFIRPTSSTSVYQLMLQKVEPTVGTVDENKAYVINDVTFTAKKEEVTITKTANKTSVTKGEKVNYTITVDIPTYSAEATDKSFSVSDLLPDGLTIDTDSINVKIDDATVDSTAYTLDTTATTGYTFKLSVTTDQYADKWAANGGKQLDITYTATLNADDTKTAVNIPETNTATFNYSYYPYVENSHKQKTDTVDVTTFAIKIDKYVDGSPTTKLSGAKFDLYRTATQAEVDAGLAVQVPHTTINGIKLESDVVTNASGVATFEKYEANGTKYDYYLVETQAPHGYNILAEAVKVNFTDADVEATDGVYTVEVPNSSGITLPITGDEGIVIFTVIGIALMAGAVILFVLFRKKAKAK